MFRSPYLGVWGKAVLGFTYFSAPRADWAGTRRRHWGRTDNCGSEARQQKSLPPPSPGGGKGGVP